MLGLTVYSAQQRGCGRGVAAAALRWWLPSAPPRTRWCARVEADHVLVPAQVNIADMLYSISIPNIVKHRSPAAKCVDHTVRQVDDALSCLYERLLAEHVTSWYQHLAQDEEFLQQLRLVLRWSCGGTIKYLIANLTNV